MGSGYVNKTAMSHMQKLARLATTTYTDPLVHVKAMLFNEPIHQFNIPSSCCHVEEGLACLHEARPHPMQPYNVILKTYKLKY